LSDPLQTHCRPSSNHTAENVRAAGKSFDDVDATEAGDLWQAFVEAMKKLKAPAATPVATTVTSAPSSTAIPAAVTAA
jgi:hypothetical protein